MSLANFGQFIHPSNQVMSHLIVSSYIADSHDSNRVARQSYCDVSKLYIDGRTTRNICVSCSLFVAQITETVTKLSFIRVCPNIENTRDCSDCAWDIHCHSTATWQPFIWLCVRHPLPQYCYMAAIHLTVRETSTATVLLHGSHSFDCAWDIHCHSTATCQQFIWLFLSVFIRSTLLLYTRVWYFVGTFVATSCYRAVLLWCIRCVRISQGPSEEDVMMTVFRLSPGLVFDCTLSQATNQGYLPHIQLSLTHLLLLQFGPAHILLTPWNNPPWTLVG